MYWKILLADDKPGFVGYYRQRDYLIQRDSSECLVHSTEKE